LNCQHLLTAQIRRRAAREYIPEQLRLNILVCLAAVPRRGNRSEYRLENYTVTLNEICFTLESELQTMAPAICDSHPCPIEENRFV